MEWHFSLSVTGVEPRDTVHGVRNTQAQSAILVYRSSKSKLIFLFHLMDTLGSVI